MISIFQYFQRSIYYYRAVGYFSSKILVEYAKGLKEFIKRNGKMKLIISPYLVPSDYDAIHKEYNLENTKKSLIQCLRNFKC